MRWFYRKRRWPPIGLYFIAPRDVMQKAREMMLAQLSRRFKARSGQPRVNK